MDSISNAENREGPSLLGIVNVVLRSWKVVVALSLLGFTAGVIYSLIKPRSYTAKASFVPQGTKSAAAGVSGLAAQFGLSLPSGDASQTPQFYVDLLTAREVLRRVSQNNYSFFKDGRNVSTTLVALWGGDDPRSDARIEATVDALGRQIGSALAQKTGVITLSVTTQRPELSRAVAQELLEQVNKFNLELRRTQAESERQFVESRLTDVSSQLRASEANLEAFLETNRDARSPRLTFEYDRLSREVAMRQQVYTSVSQVLEQARVEAIRNTPVITVIEPPHMPVRPNPRGLVFRSLLGLFAGFLLAVLFAFGRTARKLQSNFSADDIKDYQRYRSEILDVFRRAPSSHTGTTR